jgi:formate hydrogenlyase transcriptional activator
MMKDDQLSEFYSKHFFPKMPSDTKIVPISRTIGSERLVDGKRPSTEETPSDPGRETTAPPSSNVTENLRLGEEIRSDADFEGIVGRSSTFRQVLQLVKIVATSDSTVLLLGETGAGKELIARAIHNRSRRKARTFVKLNCAAIPTGLLESELFGHERGAFTGAIAQKIGRLELADQGSLFLDEIGDIPLELQPKLLRILQEREFERLGSTRTKKVDVRVVAATHRNLEAMIVEKEFRSDLYYRLNVFPISIPPLRERPEDIPQLVQYFVQQAARRMNKKIDSIPCETMDALTQYRWPGNIRELENVIERAVILSPGPVLRVPIRDLHTRIAPAHNNERSQTLEEVERKHIVTTLKETRWVLSGPRGAATRLGLNRATLYFRMKKLGIVRSSRQIEEVPPNTS